jgi:Chaperone of endosialidase
MADIANRELSQFGSFLTIDGALTGIPDNIGIATDTSIYVGIGTSLATSKLSVTGDVLVSGALTATATLNTPTIVAPTAYHNTGIVTYVTGTNLNYIGFGTINTLNSVSGVITNFTSGISSISQLRVLSGIVTNISGTAVTYTTSNISNLYVDNSYVVTGIATNISGNTINYSGLSTFNTVQISSGIITATSGIVTYYGDGSNLINIVKSVALQSRDSLVGFAITTVNFTGAGVGTVTVPFSGISTVIIDGQFPAGSNSQVQYNAAGSFAGSANFTYDGASLVSISGTCQATNFNTTSDINFKENVSTFENALSVVSELRGVRFDWKETHHPSIGVIAQELEEVLPELVTGSDPKTVNYNGIIGVLIEAIKELKTEIEDLKSNK